ncbi:MAG: hypothetical protein HC922_09105, partial [Leptolyngbyaceae cyanobacterium SM2_3_12]|nr:hypothetical protein [Leptolyngbyaceae cyanobacterium SM2_3_12]
MQHRFGFRFVIGLGSTLSLLIMVSPAGVADYIRPGPADPIAGPNTIGGTQAYTPPPDLQRPLGDHAGGGSRSGNGCGDGDIAALALDLVPSAKPP